jgi:uncharacterized protein
MEKRAILPFMATRLSFLPEGKRDELAFVVDIVREGFAFATARRSTPHMRHGKLLKILLFGSYARGDWVEDPVGRYFSDYDLLVVVDHGDLTDFDVWDRTNRRLIDEVATGQRLRTQASLNVHSLDDVNEKLRLGRYFFIDAVRDGIMLFEEEGHSFATPQPLSASEALQETRDYFEEWFEGAAGFLDTSGYAQSKGRLNEAAFLLHQAAERAYHCFILTTTLYSPKTHQLNRLRRMAEDMDPRFKTIWPNTLKSERRAYALLHDAYVKARYSRAYQILPEQLNWLGERVKLLLALVETAGRERLATLEQAA